MLELWVCVEGHEICMPLWWGRNRDASVSEAQRKCYAEAATLSLDSVILRRLNVF
jgi:hypothetical protein